MYVRVAWGRLHPGTWDEYQHLYEEHILTRTADVDGLVKRLLLRSTTDPDEGISLSFWETREAMEAYRASTLYRDELLPKLQHVFRGEWWLKEFETTTDVPL